ncbi:imidazole glycerol phosphate synthase subunit HisH [Uliginosibacterium sediminicola]|uniref:Imidazole glycerol phosphate synthase subunit HisH n=1 Tax=Uliginosibacterium sediminicola TaxID=2024550 RepID=A0ABU9YZ07_9RHOO
MKVLVVDYGMGNLRSVAKAVERVAPHAQVVVSDQAQALRDADRVIIPGQGAMHDCMREFMARGLHDALLKVAAEKPFLGICVGMQMLFDHSEEGDTPGLGILPGRVRRFPADMFDAAGVPLKVPHMGWNEVLPVKPHPLWQGIAEQGTAGERFYFVHSYYCDPADQAAVAARTVYGLPFTCAVAQANIAAIQFHPEKSAAAGLRLLANFIDWQP